MKKLLSLLVAGLLTLAAASSDAELLQYSPSTGGGGGGGTPGGSPGQVQWNSAGSFGGFTLSGDCTLVTSTGVITCTKSSGTAFGLAAFENLSGIVVDNGSGSLTLSAAGVTNAMLANSSMTIAGHSISLGGTQTIGFSDLTGSITLAQFPSIATNTILGNATSGLSIPTALSIGSCSTASSALLWTTNTGFSCNTSITANAVPAANLTGTTLATSVVTSSLTTVGTIGSGTWQGSVVGSSYGGAGSITGALKGNGSGTVSQAACTDLSNGATGCSTATGTSGATLPLLNGANTWSGLQTITNSDIALLGSSTGKNTFTAANSSSTSYTTTVPAVTGTLITSGDTGTVTNAMLAGSIAASKITTGTSGANIPLLNGANTWGALQTFGASDIALTGSSTGVTTFTSANSGSSNFTATVPAASDTIVELTQTQTLTNKSIAGSEINSGTVGNTYGGTGQNSSASTGIAQVSSGTWSFSNAITPSTVSATGAVYGTPIQLVTTSPTISTSTFAINAALGNDFTIDLSSACPCTISAPTNAPAAGFVQIIRLHVVQDGSGSRTIGTWTSASGFSFGASGAPTLSTGANKVDIIAFEYDRTKSLWLYMGSQLGF